MNSSRILDIVFGRNGKLRAQVAATPDLDPNLQTSTESETTTSNLHYVCSIHPGPPTPCNLAKSQQRRTPTTYPDCIQGNTIHPSSTGNCWEAHILPPAEPYEILLAKRYYRISRHEEDQLTIPTLLHALSQLDSPVEVIHLLDTSHSLEHDHIQEREQTVRSRLWENYAVKIHEREERLRNSSGRFPERLFQISAFKARTESIKTRVWRSKHK